MGKAESGTKEAKVVGLLRSSAVVSVMTLLSRVMGLIRDIVIASAFGAGAGADAFFVAFKIPNFLRRLFAEGAFNQAFVPVLADYQTNATKEEVKRLINAVSGVLGVSLLVVTLFAIGGARFVAWVFAPGFHAEPDKFDLAVSMLRITFPYLLLISLTAFAGSILNAYKRFAVPAFTPIWLNLVMIATALWLAPRLNEPVMALAWGVLVAGIVQFTFQMPFLYRLGLLPVPVVDFKHSGVIKILRLMLPALFGVSVSQINLLLDTVLASFLQTGSVSWLYYSDRLSELPLGVFGIAIATVILPSLSRHHAGKSAEQFSRTLDWAIFMVLLIGIPAALALGMLAEPLLITLFHYGALTEHDIAMSAQSLRAYSVGLLAFMLIKVLAPGFYARQDTKTPVKIGMVAMISNMVLNLLLIGPMAHAGLALATSISAFLNAGLLAWGLKKAGVLHRHEGWFKRGFMLLMANVALIAFLYFLVPAENNWFGWSTVQRIWHMALIIVVAVVLYLVVVFASGLRVRHLRASA
ncbi:murein biosynthesis integral membrane protein MurJ [Pokkaliibacter sp. CJK22405]|uniref:murein biosynthesis integral membrane protein MurJ n=1 Tax=Pokkaliibacter sp. CJK22405 TaxID=3384615 RepID=UPI0039850494